MERHLSAATIGILVFYAIALAGGQLLFKLAALRFEPGSTSVQNIVSLALNPFLIMAVLLYGVLSVVWVWVLRSVPLSTAYPFVALAFVLTAACGILLFKEPFSSRLVLGGLMIVTGLFVITR